MPTTKRDYYDVLGVAPGAHEDEIKRAYRKLVLSSRAKSRNLSTFVFDFEEV